MSLLEFMTEEEPKKTKSASRKRQIYSDIQKFTCASCKKEYFDMGSYFYDKPSIKCISCSKSPTKTKRFT
jgi:hydrogenase maturation factor HypF (carbamoyltransferase family)